MEGDSLTTEVGYRGHRDSPARGPLSSCSGYHGERKWQLAFLYWPVLLAIVGSLRGTSHSRAQVLPSSGLNCPDPPRQAPTGLLAMLGQMFESFCKFLLLWCSRNNCQRIRRLGKDVNKIGGPVECSF